MTTIREDAANAIYARIVELAPDARADALRDCAEAVSLLRRTGMPGESGRKATVLE